MWFGAPGCKQLLGHLRSWAIPWYSPSLWYSPACVIWPSCTNPEPSTTWAGGSDSILDHRCMPRFLAEPLLADCFTTQSGMAAFRLHPSSILADKGCGGWRDSPNKGFVAFVPSAKNKIKLKNSFMTHSKENAICLCLGHSVYKRRLVWQVDSLLHNMVCEVSREEWLLETAPLGSS